MISSEKYGTDKSMIPSNTPNFIYGSRTGNENLWRHLYNHHSEAYDKAVLQYKWKYRLSTDSSHSSTRNPPDQQHRGVPPFSEEAFLEHLVHFIVADDQASPDDLVFFHPLTNLQSIRVVECPEFRRFCMVLCGTLLDVDIPRRDKMREIIISRWRDAFGQLKSDLSASIRFLSFCFINHLWS